MDTTSYITLLIQAPLVGIFIWYSLRISHEFLDALERRDAAFERRNTALIEAINSLSAALTEQIRILAENQSEHDRFVRETTNARTTKSRQS